MKSQYNFETGRKICPWQSKKVKVTPW